MSAPSNVCQLNYCYELSTLNMVTLLYLLLFNNGYGWFPLIAGGMGRKHGGHHFEG